jgi:pimeloyl-ACP methyl ester carboxylesterase
LQAEQVTLDPYSFWVSRAGAGTPVILIHGLGGSSDWWRHNIDALAAEHLVAAVDLIGFGRNRLFLKRSSLPLTFVEIAALLARWIESSFAQGVHLVGNSMGGHIALHIASTRPDLVRSLVLVDSTGIPFALEPAAHVRELVVPSGALSFARMLAHDIFRSGPTSVLLSLARLLRDDARPLMRNIRMPVLLMWGDHDPLVPLKYANEMAELMPQARLVVLPQAGHVPMWDNAPAFNRELLTFLRDIEAKPCEEERRGFSWGLSGWTGGIAHREAGRRRDAVLLHGLGLSGAYFAPFARSMFARGVHCIAPDLPGFGASAAGPSMTAEEHARTLASWADALSIRDAVWIGHSFGCNAAARLAMLRPDLVRRVVAIGPLWSEDPPERLFPLLLADISREPLALWPFVVSAYWRCGLGRWFRTFRRYREDLRRVPGHLPSLIAGERDPLPDREALPSITEVAGAHACQFSHPEETADAVLDAIR